MHVEALFIHDDTGRLVCINEPERRPAPRFYIGCAADGVVMRFRHDLEDELVQSLEALCREVVPEAGLTIPARVSARIESLLAEVAPIERRWHGPVYRVPRNASEPSDAIAVTEVSADVLRPYLTEWLVDMTQSQPLVALVQNRRAVSLCCSGRRTPQAHEAAVETAAAFRGRGYGAQVVTKWAQAVAESGQIPLYSTSWENVASRALAEKLGLIHYGSDMHLA